MEHVTQVVADDGVDASPLGRSYTALAGRLGVRDGTVRAGQRDAEAAFDSLVAARDRLAPGVVIRRHECRHDEGIGDCRSAVTVTG